MTTLISAVILAAGESKRMGTTKQLLPLGNITILEQTIDNFLNSKVDDVIVIVGYKAKEITRLISNRRVIVAENPSYHDGMSTSIVTGLGFLSNKSRGIMIALADQPFIESPTINHLIKM